MKRIFEKVNLEDISQMVIGAAVMAVPIAFSEELWKFGETLPALNIILLFCISLIIQFFYTQFSIFQGKEKRYMIILLRVILNYFLTFITVAGILFSLNRLSFTSEFLVGLYRVIILCFPASLGAVIVDGFDKE
jgi:uncharacterized membrane protein